MQEVTENEEILKLQEQHKELKLDLMEADLLGDELLCQKIKRQKLMVKDQIERLKREL